MKAKDKDAQAEAASLAVENSRLQNEGLYLDNEFRRFQLQQAVVGATSQALRSPGSASTSGLPSAKYAIPGQADSRMDKPIPKFGWAYDDKGRLSLVPGDDYAQRYEDKLFLEYMPFIEAGMRALDSRITGDPVAGRVYNSRTGTWDKVPPNRSGRNKAKAGRNVSRSDLFDSYRNVWR